MDPNAALAAIRRLVTESDVVDLDDRELLASMLEDLANRVQGLDDWLTGGGFLPDAWAAVSR